MQKFSEVVEFKEAFIKVKMAVIKTVVKQADSKIKPISFVAYFFTGKY